VVPKPLPAAPFLLRRRYLIVVPRPLPAAPLAVRLTYLIVVLMQMLRSLPAATRRRRIRRTKWGRWTYLRSSARDRGAQADAQAAACGHTALP
jgi:hypothetical protein